MKDEIKLKDMTDFLENVYKDIKKQTTLEEEQKQEKEFINKIKGNNTNEIKEILDSVKLEINSKKSWIEPVGLNRDTWNKLLDYITNLQTIEREYSSILSENAELENEITNLQEEVKSANESITWWNNRFNAVQEENKEYKKRFNNLKKEYIDKSDYTHKLIERIDKANPMLEELNVKLKDILKIEIDIKEIIDIKNQLQGKSDE